MASIYGAELAVGWWTRVLVDFDPYGLKKYGLFIRKVQRDAFRFRWPEKEKALEFYKKAHKEFRENISKDRILEYRVQDGWGPLCKHLGVEVPKVKIGEEEVEVPFPRLNDATAHRAEAWKKFKKSQARSYRNMAECVSIIAGLGLLISVASGLVNISLARDRGVLST